MKTLALFALILISMSAFADQRDEALWRLYRGPAYHYLSGAARSLLLRHFNRQEIRTHARHGYSQRIFSTANDPLANDPGLDKSAHDTQSETSLALTANGSVAVGFNNSGAYSEIEKSNHFTGFSYSGDAGASYVELPLMPEDPTGEGDGGDPVLAYDQNSGVLYSVTIGMNGSNLKLFTSRDGGKSYSAPTDVIKKSTSGDFQDKCWIAVDNFSGQGQGNVYVVWRLFQGGGEQGGIYLVKSQDGGKTFTPDAGLPVAVAKTDNVQGAYVAIGPDHSVYVFWLDQQGGNQIKMARSMDQGASFGPAVTIAKLKSKGVNGDLSLSGNFRTNSFAQAAVNPKTGAIYVVYNDVGKAKKDNSDVYFVQSNNQGQTWSKPLRLNNDKTTSDQFFPVIAVTPDGALVFAGFYDRRLDPKNSDITTFGVIGKVSSSSVKWGANFQVASSQFPVVVDQDPILAGGYMGDYNQAVADFNFFYYSWGDNRLKDAAHANQPDIRVGKIPAK